MSDDAAAAGPRAASLPNRTDAASAASQRADDGIFPIKPVPIAVGLAIFLGLLALPAPEGLSPEGWRVVAVVGLMFAWWITEAIPLPVTALLPVALFPTFGINTVREAAAPFADPVIFLFMGGFLLALAMERWNLHRRVALNILRRTGSRQHNIIGGFMLATALCGMWVSNAATAVMIFPVAMSVAKLIEERGGSSQFPMALMLAVAYAASIGGVTTLIGTPPNAILAGTLNRAYGYDIGFAQWMIMGVPIAAVMLTGTWLILTRLAIRLDRGEIEGADALFRTQLDELGGWTRAEIRVAAIFALTAAAWALRTTITPYVPGLSDASISIFAALALFLTPSGGPNGGALIDWDTAKRLPWNILLLFGGGLSLAGAMASTGLDAWIGDQIGGYASGLPTIGIVLLITLVVLVMTEFTSNTATAAAFVPLFAVLAIGIGENPLLLAFPATLAASMTFMLPVATPPNALVFSSGYFTIGQMAAKGIWVNVLALVVITFMSYWLLITFFGVVVGEVPDWATGGAT
ncbi:SLC13 family permease [Antarcticirhabdus aurantiaca]|uniref:SLC13 family permease n=1 Tax=Antarcticirhabdus aurantiaca TaxID=2606717 RepID=A0ACD4NU66_9HYPH|nr:SLC13 family permease [Antarcticirhabdus aurantiaca]WAJ30412.1 SLC13 family permease [Jeongeuplla avenae]